MRSPFMKPIYAAAGCSGSNKELVWTGPAGNEDRFTFTKLRFKGDEVFCIAVFDGHGGSGASSYLSKHYFSVLEDLISSNSYARLEHALHDSFFVSDSMLHQQLLSYVNDLAEVDKQRCSCNFYREIPCRCLQAPLAAHEGSTGTVILLCNNRVYCGNIGDSEAFLVTRSGMVRATCDRGNRDYAIHGARSAISPSKNAETPHHKVLASIDRQQSNGNARDSMYLRDASHTIHPETYFESDCHSLNLNGYKRQRDYQYTDDIGIKRRHPEAVSLSQNMENEADAQANSTCTLSDSVIATSALDKLKSQKAICTEPVLSGDILALRRVECGLSKENLKAEIMTVSDTPVPDYNSEDYLRLRRIAVNRTNTKPAKLSKPSNSSSDGIRRGSNVRGNYVNFEGAHSLNMTRAFGNYGHKVYDVQSAKIVESESPVIPRPHINIFEPVVDTDFMYIVVASDGVWDNLSKKSVDEIVKNSCKAFVTSGKPADYLSPGKDAKKHDSTDEDLNDCVAKRSDVDGKALEVTNALEYIKKAASAPKNQIMESLARMAGSAAKQVLTESLKSGLKPDDITAVVIVFAAIFHAIAEGAL